MKITLILTFMTFISFAQYEDIDPSKKYISSFANGWRGAAVDVALGATSNILAARANKAILETWKDILPEKTNNYLAAKEAYNKNYLDTYVHTLEVNHYDEVIADYLKQKARVQKLNAAYRDLAEGWSKRKVASGLILDTYLLPQEPRPNEAKIFKEETLAPAEKKLAELKTKFDERLALSEKVKADFENAKNDFMKSKREFLSNKTLMATPKGKQLRGLITKRGLLATGSVLMYLDLARRAVIGFGVDELEIKLSQINPSLLGCDKIEKAKLMALVEEINNSKVDKTEDFAEVTTPELEVEIAELILKAKS